MRTIRIGSHQSAAMERRSCANAIRLRSSGPDDERSAHAIALCANLLARVDLLLCIQKRDIRGRILFGGASSINRAHQRSELGAIRWILKIEFRNVAENRSLRHSIKRIRHEHGVSFCAQPLGHVSERWTQPECVRPDQYSRI